MWRPPHFSTLWQNIKQSKAQATGRNATLADKQVNTIIDMLAYKLIKEKAGTIGDTRCHVETLVDNLGETKAKVEPRIVVTHQALRRPIAWYRHCETTNATRYLTRVKTLPDTLVEMLAYRLSDDEAQTLSCPLKDVYALAPVYVLAYMLGGVESDTFCYINGNIGATRMVKTLVDAQAEVIVKTLGDTLIDALYDTVAELYHLVTYLALCRIRDLLTHWTMLGRDTGRHAG